MAGVIREERAKNARQDSVANINRSAHTAEISFLTLLSLVTAPIHSFHRSPLSKP